jgi:LysR family transcriptional regulator, low CO2-responsive transcriptional regulator
MPSLAFGDMNSMIVLDGNDEYRSYMRENIDLKLLRMFSVVARVGSFTRSAMLIDVTQSAVSHGIKRLESQLGCSLFFKKGKSIHLTPEGQFFLGHVQRLLDLYDRTIESVGKRFQEGRRNLNVTFAGSVAYFILAPVLREFRESYPDVSVIVRLEDAPLALKAVEEGNTDLAIVVEDRLPKSLKAHELFQDRLQFIVSPRHSWAERQRITGRDISAQHFLLYGRNTVTFRQIEDFLLKMGVKLSSYVEIPSFEIMKQLAQLGLGVAIMAPWVAARELQEGSLVARPLPKVLIRRSWSVVHQAGRELSQAEQTFLGLCRLAAKTKIPSDLGRVVPRPAALVSEAQKPRYVGP